MCYCGEDFDDFSIWGTQGEAGGEEHKDGDIQVDQSELQRYLAEPGLPWIVSRKTDLITGETKSVQFADELEWWRVNEHRFPVVARLARRWLAAQVSSVPSERVFSDAGHLVRKKRASLSDELIGVLMFIHANCEHFDLSELE